MLNGSTPVFSQFGEDIYYSDIVKNCNRIVADEMSKLKPKHIRIDDNGFQQNINSSINRLLKNGPNELMTTAEFLGKCSWLYERKYNCFIYPKFHINSEGRRVYDGFYPLDPCEVDFLEDAKGDLFIKLHFANGVAYTFKYSEIVHWRKDFSMNDLMGGNENGNPDNRELLQILKINSTVIEGLDKAVKSSLTVNGIMKMNTMLDEDKIEAERIRFEGVLRRSESGILPMDLKGEYIPIQKGSPVIIDKNILEFIQAKILNKFNISIPIFTGDFTDEQYQAFYEQKLEPMINSLGQAITKVVFTQGELDRGNEIICYTQQLLFTNTKNKIAVADILGNRGALTDNELLALFGYPPFEGGDRRTQSLNYVDRDLAAVYQTAKAGASAGKGVKNDEE